jgi:hypothetical protein
MPAARATARTSWPTRWAGQDMRHGSRATLPAGKQRARTARADMQPQKLCEFTADGHFAPLGSFALPHDHDPFVQTHIFDAQLHQLGGAHTGLQQRLQHQTGTSILAIGMVEKAQLFFDRQPFDFQAFLWWRVQARARPRRLEDRLSLTRSQEYL